MGNMNETASRGETPLSPSSIVFLDVMVNNTTEEQCFSSNSHSSVLQGLPFGGIPTVLVLNFIIWLLLLLVFSCIRKAAWDYGRLALLMDNDSRFPPITWNSYKDSFLPKISFNFHWQVSHPSLLRASEGISSRVKLRSKIRKSLTSLFYGEQSEKEKSPSETSPLDADNKDVGFCSWLHSIYQMKDEEIQSKCGIDATTYLSFQRHILVLQTIICVLSVAVIIPVNFSGNLLGKNPTSFGRTTIVNLPKDGLQTGDCYTHTKGCPQLEQSLLFCGRASPCCFQLPSNMLLDSPICPEIQAQSLLGQYNTIEATQRGSP